MANGAAAAILAMKEGRWQDAVELWQTCWRNEGLLSASDYAAYAHACARQELWELHERIVHEGLEIFPDDDALKARRLYDDAMRYMRHARWVEAWDILEHLRAHPISSEWPVAIDYCKRNARLMKLLSGINGRQERLSAMAVEALFKDSEIRSQRLAGILPVIKCLDWSDELREGFRERIDSLIACLMHYDIPIRLIEDADLMAQVSDMATFWHANIDRLIGLPAGYCEFFARLFLAFGYLGLYVRLRGQFVEGLACLPERVHKALGVVYQLALANEQANAERYGQLKKDVLTLDTKRQEVCHFLSLSSFYHSSELYGGAVSDRDREFQEYISGKSVAIVGPVDVGLKNGPEIDSFDLVVRFNYRQGLGYEPEIFGERTDISYYLRAVLIDTPALDLLAGMSLLDYAVVDEISWRECRWLDQVDCRKRERFGVWHHWQNPMLIGYPGAIQRALLDLLRFSPARIKIFSADMYTGMHYRQEYLSHSTLGRNGGNVFPSFSLHDPISNFLFMQRLVQAASIEVDDVLANIVSLTVPQYIERLRGCHARFLARLD